MVITSRSWIAAPVLLACLCLASCARPSAEHRAGPPDGAGGFTQTGILSYYADRFHGRTTANGEIFDKHALTAAHRTLPFHTRIKVTNLENGRSVVVRINDRGPFIAERIVDLSPAAAREIGMVERGLTLGQLSLLP